jgi:hypothetical protein
MLYGCTNALAVRGLGLCRIHVQDTRFEIERERVNLEAIVARLPLIYFDSLFRSQYRL